ncbi:MAG: bifunctional homocysteine S-methyltransferase/methylenetetrahydrofolate reductase, partial [Thermoanaerobaculia bacterium]
MKETKKNLFLEFLKEKPVLADGAIGTYLYQKGFGRCPSVELENILNPEAVYEVHKEYIKAGSKIITTNTFGANRINYQKKNILFNLKDINTKGVQIAKKAAKGLPIWVGASVGPLSVMLKPYGDVEEEEAKDVCVEQVKYLIEEEPDLFIVESQKSVLEAIFFIDSIKKLSPDIPILASLTISKEGRTFFGDDFLEGLLKLQNSGADVVGLNCSLGPSDMLYFVEKAIEGLKVPLSIMPNGGYPAEVDKRIIFLSEPNYFASLTLKYVVLGAAIVGGCCGTNPETIRKIKEKIEEFKKGKRVEPILIFEIEREEEKKEFEGKPLKEGFFKKLGKEFVITCEVEPPKGPDIKNIIENVKVFKNLGVDAINIADNPMARARVSPLAVAHFIHSETGLSTILHLTCRDRNLLALQSEILGASLLGISGILVLGGDPTALGDYPEATSVYDVNVTGLIKIISSLNGGLDFSDNIIDPPTNFSIGIAIGIPEENLEKEI